MPWLRPLTRAFRRPFGHLRRRWPLVVGGMLLVPVHAGVMLWMPRLLGETLDQLTTGGDRAALAATCWLLLGLAAAEALSRFASRKLIIDASRLVEQSLKDEMVAHLQRLPVAWFDKSRTGDLTSRMTQDVELVRFVMGPLLLHGGSTVCLLPAGFVLMLTMDLPVALSSLAALAAVFVAMRFVVPKLHAWSKKSQEAIAEVSQQAQEDFAGVRVVQQFDGVDRELAAMATRNRRYLLANLRLVRLRSLLNALMHSTGGVVMLGVLLVGGHQVITGRITIGQLFQFTGYLALMTFPLQILGWTIAMIPRAQAAGERIEEIFDVAPEQQGGERPTLRGDVEVRDLTFTYPGADRPALRDVSFAVPAGAKLGLIGPVGSGKSTLLALLLRLYEPPPGTVFVDGHDVRDIDPRALRELFALAPQEPFLFSDTIASNVTFDEAVTDARRDEAVAAAALDQDLPQLRDGLATIVGERGVTLSGGQKQRVSLARAVLSDRPGLLLDDTLSAVDPNTERRILDGLRDTRGGRTVVAASHRLSVTRDADLILVLEDGAVVERGSHDELMRRGGRYAAAWRRQTEAEALEGDGEARP
ncbi:MAG: ABC transporter ATP-binding protein [Planctomycetes bacterium]|nr:ABC transporter ATP-binding protein [Planctomycetota bacterium]